MRWDEVEPSVRALWAKSDRPVWHGLLAHLLDVAATALEILEREPDSTVDWLGAALGLEDRAPSRLRPLVAAWVGLHDLGKATPGFARKWLAGADRISSAGLTLPLHEPDRHDAASRGLVRDALRQRVAASLAADGIAAAVAAHHGHFVSPGEARSALQRRGREAWDATRARLVDAYFEAMSIDGSVPVAQVPFHAQAWLAGLTSVADWIGSNDGWFSFCERGTTTSEHFAMARTHARQALGDIGWTPGVLSSAQLSVDDVVSRMVGSAVAARSLQRAADELLRDVTGPALLVVEAPMGEGKTEVAFLAHLRLQARLGTRGLFVAMPTQATGNAMFVRTVRFLQAFAPGHRLDIQLAHGGAFLNEPLITLRGIDESDTEAVASSAWFAQRRRPLLSPYGVGTVDQALLSVLNTKHHFVRLFGLGNRTVVIDEVHAFDAYTSTLIEALLKWLRALGASVVLMSATLPRARLAAFQAAWGERGGGEARYPRIALTDTRGTRAVSFDTAPGRTITLERVGADLGAMADWLSERAAADGCGAVVVNTVARAQQLFLVLRDRLGHDFDLRLFHARFPADQRAEIERATLEAFGRVGVRPARVILVATQVVEQSLDLDFDYLLTDLAPIDLVLQRAGRLHRHARSRPMCCSAPVLGIAGLLGPSLPDLNATGWRHVYVPVLPLLRSWVVLRRLARIELPADIDPLVQQVYDGSDLGDVGELSGRLADAVIEEAKMMNERRQLALTATVFPDASAVSLPVDVKEEEDPGVAAAVALTRLGVDSVSVVPVHVVGSEWRISRESPDLVPVSERPRFAVARALVQTQVRLSRRGVVQALRSCGTPPGWQKHPWLRSLHPLPLREGRVQLGHTVVRLDDTLGIVYESPEKTT